uniref:Uncharacterized protein n=1 Tax=Anguilla anguilla TaxID=7936 RepID=A0A0E9SRM8_ANGAN
MLSIAVHSDWFKSVTAYNTLSPILLLYLVLLLLLLLWKMFWAVRSFLLHVAWRDALHLAMQNNAGEESNTNSLCSICA